MFKNFVKKHWAPDDGGAGRITSDDRQTIKTEVVDVMVRVSEGCLRAVWKGEESCGSVSGVGSAG